MKFLSAAVVVLSLTSMTQVASAYESTIDAQIKSGDYLEKTLQDYAQFDMPNGEQLWARCSGKNEVYVVTWYKERTYLGFFPASYQKEEGYFAFEGCERDQFEPLEKLHKKLSPGQFTRVKFDRSADVQIGK